MNGFEATKQLKLNSRTTSIPVIAITASFETIDRSTFVKKGFDGFLSKPVTMDRFFGELTRFLSTEHNAELNSDDFIDQKKESEFQDHLPPEKLNYIQEIIDVLESDFKEQWRAFHKKQPIKDVKAFGKGLKELGIKYQLDYLSNYGDSLILHVENYDIDNIRYVINQFPVILKKLKTMLGGEVK